MNAEQRLCVELFMLVIVEEKKIQNYVNRLDNKSDGVFIYDN